MKIYQIIRFSIIISIFVATCFAQSNLQKIILTPVFEKNSAICNLDENDTVERRILAKLRAKSFKDVSVTTEKGIIVLRGTVPKGKLAEAIQAAQEANNGKPIRNELTER